MTDDRAALAARHPTTEAGKRLLDDLVPHPVGHEADCDDCTVLFGKERKAMRDAILAIEAEARASLLRELDWRDINDWEKAIRQWLGPQRMSTITRTHQLEDMAQGAVVAGAILRHLLDPSAVLR